MAAGNILSVSGRKLLEASAALGGEGEAKTADRYPDAQVFEYFECFIVAGRQRLQGQFRHLTASPEFLCVNKYFFLFF